GDPRLVEARAAGGETGAAAERERSTGGGERAQHGAARSRGLRSTPIDHAEPMDVRLIPAPCLARERGDNTARGNPAVAWCRRPVDIWPRLRPACGFVRANARSIRHGKS